MSQLLALDPRTTGISEGLPIAYAPDNWRFTRLEALALLCLIGVQCIALRALAAHIRRLPRAAAISLVAIGAALMIAIAFNAKASTSSDPYFYLLYAKAPTFATAFANAPIPVHPGFEPLQRFVADRPGDSSATMSVYGPVWIAASRLAVARSSNIADGFLGLRVLAVLSILVILWAARSAGASSSVLSLIALNPALYHFEVVECHNDALAIAFIFVGLAAARSMKLRVAAVVAGLAGLVKIMFVPIALATLAGIGTVKQRVGVAALVLATVAVGSVVFPGAPSYISYLALRMLKPSGIAATRQAGLFHGFELAAVAVAFIAIGLMVFANVWWRRALWTLPAVTVQQIWPWYILWPLPVALRAGDGTAVRFLMVLPAASILLTHAFGLSLLGIGLNSVYLLLALLYALSEAVPLARGSLRAQRRGV